MESTFAKLAALTEELGARKPKMAADAADPADHKGPTAGLDNHTKAIPHTEADTKNEEALEADQGAHSVDNASEAQTGGGDRGDLNIGMQASTAGHAPEIEKNLETHQKDPGTSMGASTENKELTKQSFAQQRDRVTDLCNEVLTGIWNSLSSAKTAEAAPAPATPTTPAAQPEAKPVDTFEAKLAAAKAAVQTPAPAAPTTPFGEGYELAAQLGLATKEAAEAVVQNAIEDTLRSAIDQADLVGNYVTALVKKAADEESEGGESDEGGEEPPKEPKEESSSGEGGGGGESSGPPSGGSDSAAAGGPPMGGPPMGGPPPGAGGMGGSPSVEELIMALLSALTEQGMAPGDLDGAGMAGAPPQMAAEGAKLASIARERLGQGNFRYRKAASGREQYLRNYVAKYITELTKR